MPEAELERTAGDISWPALPAWQRGVGIATVVVFLGTGWVLRLHQPPMEALAAGPRMLLRSGHIYLLFAGLLNLALGMGDLPDRGARGWVARTGTLLVIAAAALLAVGFFVESRGGELDRPLTMFGIFSAFGGTLLRLGAASRRSAPDS